MAVMSVIIASISFFISSRPPYMNNRVCPVSGQRSLYVIRSQVVFPTFTCRWKKDHSSRRFLLILGMGALLSAVSAGVAVSAVILYHLGIIFGVFLPCKPVKKSFGIADRVRGSPLVLYGFGYILGWFLSLLFLPFHRLAFPA